MKEDSDDSKDKLQGNEDAGGMDQEHEEGWKKLASGRQSSILAVLLSLALWAVEFMALIGIVIPWHRIFGLQAQEEEFEWTEELISFMFHLTACTVRFTSSMLKWGPNDGRIKEETIKWLANVVYCLKPYRILRSYVLRRRYVNTMKSNLKRGKGVDEEEIKKLIVVSKLEVEESYYGTIETFIQNVPLSLLQLYFLFRSFEALQICKYKNIAKICHIISTVSSASGISAEYNWNYRAYIKALHFLDYYRYKGHRVNLEIQSTITHIFDRVTEALFITHRFYAIAFFMTFSLPLTLFYILVTLALQSIQLIMFPSFRPIVENPPVCVTNLFARLLTQWINLFSNYNTNFTLMTKTKKWFTFNQTRVPFVLLQLFNFIITMVLCYFFCQYFCSEEDIKEATKSVRTSNEIIQRIGVNDSKSFDVCSALSSSDTSIFARTMGSLLFSVDGILQPKIFNFNELFNVIQFLPFTFYIYVLSCWTYAFYNATMHTYNERFPLQMAMPYWRQLLCNVFREPIETKRKYKLQQLMTLTMLTHDQFFRLRVWNILKLLNISRAEIVIDSHRKRLVNQIKEESEDLKNKLEVVASPLIEKHPLKFQLQAAFHLMNTDDRDRKLFLLFFKFFKAKMVEMTSYRIEKTFEIMGYIYKPERKPEDVFIPLKSPL